MQQLIRRRPGVLSTRVGYSGGDVPNATYRNHGTHVEAIEIVFNPDETTYRDLLEFVFEIHDPTTPNRQGNDRGTSYGFAIFYTSDEQRRTAEETIADINASGLWPGRVVTEVARFLGRGTGTSRLSGTHPRCLHLPLRSSGLEVAAAKCSVMSNAEACAGST
jgi:methionine-S-sulfoxide reductase